MTREKRECPKCRKAMEPGFVLDQTYGAMTRSSWMEGTPVKGFWEGLKLKGRARIPVTTFRCRGCGYLESYAA